MTSKKKKVYCRNCAYLSNGLGFVCYHPELLKIYDTWYDKQEDYPFAEDVNKNNDCPRYYYQR